MVMNGGLSTPGGLFMPSIMVGLTQAPLAFLLCCWVFWLCHWARKPRWMCAVSPASPAAACCYLLHQSNWLHCRVQSCVTGYDSLEGVRLGPLMLDCVRELSVVKLRICTGGRGIWGHLWATADEIAAHLADPAWPVRHVRCCSHAGRRFPGFHQSRCHLCGVQQGINHLLWASYLS